MHLSYGRYWEALYEEGNEDEGMLIFHSILLLYLPLFLEVVQFYPLILVINLISYWLLLFYFELTYLVFHVIKTKLYC